MALRHRGKLAPRASPPRSAKGRTRRAGSRSFIPRRYAEPSTSRYLSRSGERLGLTASCPAAMMSWHEPKALMASSFRG